MLSNSLCDCHSLNITEPHYNWSVNKLFTVTHLLRKQKLVITALHILVEIHFYYDFPLFSSSPNCLENLMKKVLKKMVQCVILRHSVRARTIILRVPTQHFLFLQVQVKLVEMLLAQQYQSFKHYSQHIEYLTVLKLYHALINVLSGLLW